MTHPKVHAYIFLRSHFSAAQARAWLRRHRHRSVRIEESDPKHWVFEFETDAAAHELVKRKVPNEVGVWAVVHKTAKRTSKASKDPKASSRKTAKRTSNASKDPKASSRKTAKRTSKASSLSWEEWDREVGNVLADMPPQKLLKDERAITQREARALYRHGLSPREAAARVARGEYDVPDKPKKHEFHKDQLAGVRAIDIIRDIERRRKPKKHEFHKDQLAGVRAIDIIRDIERRRK
jgi:hypothetical protein